jgi:ribosomal protein S18 acetylase RimI-like enzyme
MPVSPSHDLRRAFELMARGDMGGLRSEHSRYGLAVFNDELPMRFDSNYLLVDELDPAVTADELLAEAVRLQRPSVFVRDLETATRLTAGFEGHGWRLHRGLVMAYQGGDVVPADEHDIREVAEAELRPARRRQGAEEYGAPAEVIEQLLDAKVEIGRAVTARFFAVFAGDEVISYTDLYSDGETAQVEDVATLREHRRHGHASRLVAHAVRVARAEGCSLVFLVADDDGDAKRLYQRLGFNDLGRYVKFIQPELPGI